MKLDVEIIRPDIWPIAVQGPKAETLMARVFGDEVCDIRFFRYKRLPYRGHEFIVARSGWSGQGGFEIYIDDVELGQGVPNRLVGVVCPHAPTASRYCQLLVDGIPVGDITSQTLSARYDAWLCFVYLESELIDALKDGSAELQMQYNNELYEASLCELPFKLGERGLAERIRYF